MHASYHTDNLKTKEPKLRHLHSWLREMAADWNELGTTLGVSSGILKSYKCSTADSDVDKLLGILSEWHDSQCSPYSFEQLIICLCNIKKTGVAYHVINKLKDESTLLEYN